VSRTRAAIVAAVIAGTAAPARAQTPQPGRVEAAVGLQWTRASAIGAHDANETTADGGAFQLFSSATQLGSAAGLEGRVGVKLTRRIDIEATGSYSRPDLRVTASNDRETSDVVTATEKLQLFSVSAAVVALVPVGRLAERTIPFVTAGVGYARELHENDTLAVGGPQFYAGGGVKRVLAAGGRRVKAVGVRGDARVVLRPKSLAVDDRVHASIALTASLFVRF